MKMLPNQGGFYTLQTISKHLDIDFANDDNYDDDEDMLMMMMMMDDRLAEDGSDPIINNSRTSSTSKLSWKRLKHAESEQKRRQRINTHHATLRHLFPNLLKKDKASLLGETVRRLRELNEIYRKQDEEGGGEGWLRSLPGESNESTVSYCEGGIEGTKRVKMTICCEDNPSLNRELMDTIRSVHGKAVWAEMSTIGGRTKAAVVVEWPESGGGGGGEEDVSTLKRALRAIVDNRAFDCGRLMGRTYASTKWNGLAQEFLDTKQASQVSVSNDSIKDGLAEGLVLRSSV